MKKTILNPEGLFRHSGFSRVTMLEGPMKLILIAGQTPSDENYRCVAPGDMRAQYLAVMKNLELQLRAAKATWADVVYRRTFVLDVDAYLKVSTDPTTPKFFSSDTMPGSTMIGVTRLSHPDFLIEVDLLAAVSAK
jgi:enamine deaminase RidA (YjgF/YER057c/UK114 family)